MTEIEKEIRYEICKALKHLGASMDVLAAIRDSPKEQLYEEAERLGADAYFLASIGSWGDTLSDEYVLADLKHWNTALAG